MTRLRLAAVSAAVAGVVMLSGASTALAQSPPAFTKQLAITGKNKGKDFAGTYTVKRFESSGGKLFAVGTLKGKLKHRSVTRKNVRIPATLAKATGAGASQLPPNPTPGACQILDLVLNPIDLNLLGLHVATSRIEVLIEAIPGDNALLGNLLCAITGLLDPQTQSASDLSSALNAITALVPKTG
jgi:hypothetical protein